MAEVTTAMTDDSVSATAVVDAPVAAIFDFLRRPANHPTISGDRSVRGTVVGPETLGAGDRFGMAMRMVLPYRVTSKVVEFDADRRIAWSHFSGHRWRWTLEPVDAGRTRVTETFDMSTAVAPFVLRRLLGMPGKQRGNVARSVRNLAAHFDAAPQTDAASPSDPASPASPADPTPQADPAT